MIPLSIIAIGSGAGLMGTAVLASWAAESELDQRPNGWTLIAVLALAGSALFACGLIGYVFARIVS